LRWSSAQPKSIYAPWGWGKEIDFQAIPESVLLIPDTHKNLTFYSDLCYTFMLRTTGYILLLISCLSFISILIVPWIGFSKMQIAGITTGLIIAGEILFYLSLFILGRSFWDKIKSKLKFWKAKTNGPGLPEQSDIK
jgi:hypothetical protein